MVGMVGRGMILSRWSRLAVSGVSSRRLRRTVGTYPRSTPFPSPFHPLCPTPLLTHASGRPQLHPRQPAHHHRNRHRDYRLRLPRPLLHRQLHRLHRRRRHPNLHLLRRLHRPRRHANSTPDPNPDAAARRGRHRHPLPARPHRHRHHRPHRHRHRHRRPRGLRHGHGDADADDEGGSDRARHDYRPDCYDDCVRLPEQQQQLQLLPAISDGVPAGTGAGAAGEAGGGGAGGGGVGGVGGFVGGEGG